MLVSNDLCNLNELIISSGRWFSTGPKWIRHLVFHIWHDEVRPTPHFSSSFMTTFQFQWAVQAASSKKLASPTPSSLLEIKERTVHFPNTENNSRLTNPCSNECCMLYTSSDFGLSQSRPSWARYFHPPSAYRHLFIQISGTTDCTNPKQSMHDYQAVLPQLAFGPI